MPSTMRDLDRQDFLLLVEALGLPVPVTLDDVGGLLEQSGRDSVIAFMGAIPPRMAQCPPAYHVVAEMPISWGLEYLRKNNEDAKFLDANFDNAFVGIWFQVSRLPVAVYDRAKVIRRMAEITDAEDPDYGLAVCQFESEVGSAYHGEGTPAFLTRYVGY